MCLLSKMSSVLLFGDFLVSRCSGFSYRWTSWLWKITGSNIQDFTKTTGPLRVCYRIFLNLTKKNWKMSTYNRLVLEPMSGKNRQLVVDEPVEFEKWPVDVQDFRRITDHFGGGKKEKKKKELGPYIVPAWMWARYSNAQHGRACCSMRSYASFGMWALLVKRFDPILGRCGSSLFVVKFSFVL